MKTTSQHQEFYKLLERLCEDRLSATDVARLEEFVLSDCSARQYYLEYIQLHGTLHWDAAGGLNSPDITTSTSPRQQVPPGRYRRFAMIMATVAALLVSGWFLQRHYYTDPAEPTDIADNPANQKDQPLVVMSPVEDKDNSFKRLPDKPPRLTMYDSTQLPKGNKELLTNSTPPVIAQRPDSSAEGSTPLGVISYINSRIEQGWQEGEVAPSPEATDEEWVRRVSLDIAGQIPSAKMVDDFVQEKHPDKHSLLIDSLLEDPAYVSHFTTVWTNLLIGRDASRDVDRESLEQFLSDSFAKNKSWDNIAGKLISAEGDAEENGAANFLLAHLNNQAVPATAITARLFLGTQVQCTQCHDHPFNDWKQNQFWELNCFFKQTKKVRSSQQNRARLISQQKGGPTFYENRRGVMRAAYPKFSGKKVNPAPEVNRRKELSRLVATGEKPLLAKAMVNRMWAHFMGFGFTHPIDDMGPHNPPTHPELLDQLTINFVSSGYDLKQLIRWICNSRVYHLTSRYNDNNQADDPEAGNAPLFSRMYMKAMSAEQLFDSLVVATSSHRKQSPRIGSFPEQRQQWLQQFVFTFETEENDELMDFSGTVPQALMMMNGTLMHRALDAKPGSLLHHVTRHSTTERERIRQLYLVALSRYPSSKEVTVVRNMLRKQRKARFARNPLLKKKIRAEEYQDIFWALLNSNEFLLVH